MLGCDKFVVFDYYLRGEFDAVYCYIPEKGIPCKKDTAISFSAEELVLLHLKKDSEGQNYGRIDYGISWKDKYLLADYEAYYPTHY